MASVNERVKEGRASERRHRRSGCLADALRLQLEACREDEGLAAIVVSDEHGFCVAHSGGDGSHDELAARLPMLADPALRRSFDDRRRWLQLPRAPWRSRLLDRRRQPSCLRREGARAATETSPAGAETLARVASGFTRLLAQ